MRNLFKTYDVQFGSCNILRACWYYPYYWRYEKYPFYDCLSGECSCLLIDAGTIIKDEAVQKSYADKVANDVFYYSHIDVLISHFHYDHFSLISKILKRVEEKQRFFGLDLRRDSSKIANNLYIYSPFGVKDEFYLTILDFAKRIANGERILDKEYFILFQFILTKDLRDLVVHKNIKVHLLTGGSEFEVNNQIFRVLDKSLEREKKLNNFVETNSNFRELIEKFKNYLTSSDRLRLLGKIARAFRHSELDFISNTENIHQNTYKKFINIVNEGLEYPSSEHSIDEEIELFKQDLRIIVKDFLNNNDLDKFKKILKKENFDPHRFNLAFYSTDHSFIYFGDNNPKDTEEGFVKLLQNSKKDSIDFDVSVANHHATRRYAKRMYKFDGKIFFYKVYCSNWRGNDRYQKICCEIYSHFCNSLFATNLRLENPKSSCPVYVTNDTSFGTLI